MVNLRRRNRNRTTPRPIRVSSSSRVRPRKPAAGFALGKRALEVEHVGSTSVPALAAKPIIDILPVVAYGERGLEDLRPRGRRLRTAFSGSQGIGSSSTTIRMCRCMWLASEIRRLSGG
jgi:GrpB-like predicted nucleotidyltransferase (UPF0157 family)